MKKTNSRPRFLLIKGTVFPFDTLISIATDEELHKYLKDKLNYNLDQEEVEHLKLIGNGKCCMLKCHQTVIRLARTPNKIGFDLSTLSHEIVHAAFFIFDKIGIKLTGDTDEVYAYYQAYIMREVLKSLK